MILHSYTPLAICTFKPCEMKLPQMGSSHTAIPEYRFGSSSNHDYEFLCHLQSNPMFLLKFWSLQKLALSIMKVGTHNNHLNYLQGVKQSNQTLEIYTDQRKTELSVLLARWCRVEKSSVSLEFFEIKYWPSFQYIYTIINIHFLDNLKSFSIVLVFLRPN